MNLHFYKKLHKNVVTIVVMDTQKPFGSVGYFFLNLAID